MALAERSPSIVNTLSLPTAYNVCNQTLREVCKADGFSVAHVRMEQGATSLLHVHKAFSEIYYILRGKGVLYAGPNAYHVSEGSYLVIPPKTPHMLENTGWNALSHLVIAAPPFNAQDVMLLEEKNYARPAPTELLRRNNKIVALDGATVTELLTEQEQQLTKVSLAIGELEAQRKAHPHIHNEAEEVYYLLDGIGTVTVGETTGTVGEDHLVYVPRHSRHALENRGTVLRLQALCISSPPYNDRDFVPG